MAVLTPEHQNDLDALIKAEGDRDALTNTLAALLKAWDDWYDGIPVSGDLANALDEAHLRLWRLKDGK